MKEAILWDVAGKVSWTGYKPMLTMNNSDLLTWPTIDLGTD